MTFRALNISSFSVPSPAPLNHPRSTIGLSIKRPMHRTAVSHHLFVAFHTDEGYFEDNKMESNDGCLE